MIKSIINSQSASNISIEDRAFQYGDGVFETIAVDNKKLQFWSEHYQRLIAGCKKLAITPPSEQLLLEDIRQLVTDENQYVVKLIVSRGCGGRGYLADSSLTPNIVVTLNDWSGDIQQKQEAGIRIRICQHRLVINPTLAGIKHLNRLDQVIARNEWHNSDFDEGIMLDLNDNLLEGTASNLFAKINNQWHTAAVQDCAVAGVIRAFVLEQLTNKNKVCIENKMNKSELPLIEEMFVCNSVWGIVPVTQCEEFEFSTGNDTRDLQKEMDQQVDSRSYVI